jgi:hypothetical protein
MGNDPVVVVVEFQAEGTARQRWVDAGEKVSSLDVWRFEVRD